MRFPRTTHQNSQSWHPLHDRSYPWEHPEGNLEQGSHGGGISERQGCRPLEKVFRLSTSSQIVWILHVCLDLLGAQHVRCCAENQASVVSKTGSPPPRSLLSRRETGTPTVNSTEGQ